MMTTERVNSEASMNFLIGLSEDATKLERFRHSPIGLLAESGLTADVLEHFSDDEALTAFITKHSDHKEDLLKFSFKGVMQPDEEEQEDDTGEEEEAPSTDETR